MAKIDDLFKSTRDQLNKDVKVSGTPVDTDLFGRFVSNNLLSVFQKSTTGALGGPIADSRTRQTLGQIQSIANRAGFDSPLARGVINTLSKFTGITLNEPVGVDFPNIIMTTTVNGQNYTFSMYESEEDIQFTDTVNWVDTEIMGRSSQVFNYKNSSATEFQLQGFLKVDSKSDVSAWYRNMSNLEAMKYPANSDLGIMAPPLWNLTVLNPYLASAVITKTVRVNSTNYSFMKPYLEDNIPTITKITLNLMAVEDQVQNAQVSYQSGERLKRAYFNDKGSSNSSPVTSTVTPNTDIIGNIIGNIISSF